jgi:hypothetical protein
MVVPKVASNAAGASTGSRDCRLRYWRAARGSDSQDLLSAATKRAVTPDAVCIKSSSAVSVHRALSLTRRRPDTRNLVIRARGAAATGTVVVVASETVGVRWTI